MQGKKDHTGNQFTETSSGYRKVWNISEHIWINMIRRLSL